MGQKKTPKNGGVPSSWYSVCKEKPTPFLTSAMQVSVASLWQKVDREVAAHKALGSFVPPPPVEANPKGRPRNKRPAVADDADAADAVLVLHPQQAVPVVVPPLVAVPPPPPLPANAPQQPARPAAARGKRAASVRAVALEQHVDVFDVDAVPPPKRPYTILSSEAKLSLGEYVMKYGARNAEKNWVGPNGVGASRSTAQRVGELYKRARAAAGAQQPAPPPNPTPAQKMALEAALKVATDDAASAVFDKQWDREARSKARTLLSAAAERQVVEDIIAKRAALCMVSRTLVRALMKKAMEDHQPEGR